MSEYIYSFNAGVELSRKVLGEKGRNLMEMTKMGLPIPYGFVITTEASMKTLEDKTFFSTLRGSIFAKIEELELVSGREFSKEDDEKPLQLVVRSSAFESVYNTEETVLGIATYEELEAAILKVINKPNPKAGENMYPAVIVQIMLHGDMLNSKFVEKPISSLLPEEAEIEDLKHFDGTFYTRNPETGLKALSGDLIGNDENFQKIAELLEKKNKCVLEIKYMVENGKLEIIHAIRAKLTAKAAIKVAADMVTEGLIDKPSAIRNIVPKRLDDAIRKDRGEISEEMSLLLKWADEIRTLKIRANAENVKEIEEVTAFGADGLEMATIIKTPYETLTCDEMVEEADYMSFDMDSITTMTYGYSKEYEPIDEKSVGKLITIGAEVARKAKPRIKLGLKVNSGMDYETVAFCVKSGLDYITCEPNQVIIARLFAAQAKLNLE